MRSFGSVALLIVACVAGCQEPEPLPDLEAKECESHSACLVFPEGETPFCDGSCVAIEEIGRCCGCLNDAACLPDVDAEECSSVIEDGGSVQVLGTCASDDRCRFVCEGVLAPVP